jgi:hypothetical protein
MIPPCAVCLLVACAVVMSGALADFSEMKSGTMSTTTYSQRMWWWIGAMAGVVGVAVVAKCQGASII